MQYQLNSSGPISVMVSMETTARFLPSNGGVNEMSDQTYLAAEGTDTVQNLIADRVLVVVEPPAEVASAKKSNAVGTPPDGDIPDLAEMTVEEGLAAIGEITDRTVLQLLLEAEKAGKHRKTLINELSERLS